MVIIHTHTHTHTYIIYTHIYMYIYIYIYIYVYIYSHIYMAIYTWSYHALSKRTEALFARPIELGGVMQQRIHPQIARRLHLFWPRHTSGQ